MISSKYVVLASPKLQQLTTLHHLHTEGRTTCNFSDSFAPLGSTTVVSGNSHKSLCVALLSCPATP